MTKPILNILFAVFAVFAVFAQALSISESVT